MTHHKKSRLSLGLLSLAVLAFAMGCSDPDTVVVDFSKAVAVDRTKERSSEPPRLRVAVAAMISPKETFIYYRELLDYIGRSLGMEAQLIQRKTYGEINELFGKG
jgi:phosphonate transport system substrate-binding protein